MPRKLIVSLVALTLFLVCFSTRPAQVQTLKMDYQFKNTCSSAVAGANAEVAALDLLATCTAPPPSMIGWWPGEGNADDVRGENNGTLVNGTTFSAGKVGQSFSFDGVDDFVKLPDNFLLYPTGGSSNAPLSFEAWFKTNAGGVIFGQQDVDPFNTVGGAIPAVYVGTDGKLYAQMFWKGSVDPIVSPGTVNDGIFHHVAVTYDGTNEQVYLDGVVIGTKAFTQQSYAAVYKYQFGTGNTGTLWPAAPTGTGGWFSFNGLLDEPTLYTRALSQTEIQSIIAADNAGKCKPRCTPPPNNLISWYTGDDNPFDIFGINHGTLQNGATFANGKVGRAFSFDGVDDYVRIPISPSLQTVSNAITIDMWVKLNSLPPNTGSLLLSNHIQSFGSPISGVNLAVSPSGNVTFQTRLNNACCQAVTSNAVIQIGTWQHIAGVWDGANLRVYIDGTADTVVAASGTLQMNRDIFLGINSDNFFGGTITHQVNGLIDEVEIFDRALSATEIQTINNTASAGKCKQCLEPPANMVGWWSGDANSNDSSGSAYNGTLSGSASYAVGRVGQAFSFDGNAGSVVVSRPGGSDALNMQAGNFTVDAWVKIPPTAPIGNRIVFDDGYAGASTLRLAIQDNKAELWIRDSSFNQVDVIGTTALNDGAWHHLAGVRSGMTGLIYVDGQQEGSVTNGSLGSVASTCSVAFIGGTRTDSICGSPGTENLFIGQIDEVEVFNRVLTQTEIQSMVAAGTSGKCKRGTTTVGVSSSNQLGDATITLANVSNGGTTTYQTLPTYQPGPMPFGFNSPLHVADISTTATFSGGVNVCFNLQASEFAGPFTQLRVLHLEGNDLVNRTTSANPNTRTLCATVTSLSPFVIAQNPNLPTAAAATISGSITTSNGSPLAGVSVNLGGSRSARTITDSNGNYYFNNVDTDQFYTVTPSLVNYHFSPTELSFSLLGNKTDAVFTATPDAVIIGNAIDTADYFVRQHYLDFLGREPDEGGFNLWSDQILACGSDAGCIERTRISVSAAYFLSIEFQQTGGFVDGLYRVSYGRAPRYAEFMPDRQNVARDVVVGRSDWAGQLEANKRAFIDAWIQRAEFRAAYDGLSNSALVEALLNHSPGFTGNRDALVTGLDNGSLTRAAALRQVVENEGFTRAKFNEMFVLMEYFGYLRRDPDASGYQFWLNKLNQFGGNFEQAEMVKAFIVSGEYRGRFPR
jgi:hypothetical protein